MTSKLALCVSIHPIIFVFFIIQKPRQPKAKRELKKVAEAPGQQTLNSFVLTGGNSSGGGDSTIPSGTENVQRNEQQPPSVATQAVAEEETRSRNDPGMLVLFWSGFEVFLSHISCCCCRFCCSG